MNYVNFVRMERLLDSPHPLPPYPFKFQIESYITLMTPQPMPFDEACHWAERELPGWEAICGSLINPDEEQHHDRIM